MHRLLALLVLLLPSTAFALDVPYTTLDIDTALTGAGVVQAADLDGDGDDDLVIAAFFADELCWYENTSGDGTTWVKTVIESNFDYAYGLRIADVDGDGDPDILGTATSSDEVAWWENDLSGAASWTKTVIDTLDDPWSVEAADLDADGDLDVIAAGDIPNTLNWYENTAGDGSAWTTHPIDTNFGGANWARAGDIDGDGTIDVLSTGYDADEVAWYANTAGDGTAWTKSTIATGADGALSADLADLDGDGDLDVAFGSEVGDEVVWAENTGGAWVSTVIGTPDRPSWVEARDLDQDGDLDLVVASANEDEVATFENDAGTFTEEVQLTIDGAWGATPADLDGDGDLDLATVAGFANTAGWLRNDAIHSTSRDFTKTAIGFGSNNARHATVADLDGDGDLDILGADDDSLDWSENTAGDASAWTRTSIDTSAGFWCTDAADLNGDGQIDFIAGDVDNGELAWFEVTGGTYTRSLIGGGLGNQRDIDHGDLDGDGDLDVLVSARGVSALYWYANDGSAGTWTRSTVSTRPGAFAVKILDFDVDGDLDILTAFDTDGVVVVFTNDGAGSFTENVIGSALLARWVDAADVDGDGDYDVALSTAGTNANNGEVHLLVNPGSLTATWTDQLLDSGLWAGWFIQFADFDLDGDPDIISSPNTELNHYENTASGWVKTTLDTGLNILHGDVGDLDRDGDLDIVMPHLSLTDGFFIYPNDRYQVELTATDVSPSGLQGGGATPLVLDLQVDHLGRAGDSDAEMTSVGLSFLDGGVTPLLASDMNALLDAIDVLGDTNQDGVCNQLDGSVGTLTDFSSISGGLITVPLTSGLAGAGAESSAHWCVQLTLDAAAAASGITSLTTTLRTDSSVASDAAAALTLTAFGTDATSTVSIGGSLTANPGGPYAGAEGAAVTLDGSGSSDSDGVVVSWEWDCDGDTAPDATGSTASCTFDDDGVYAITLTVTDDSGNIATATGQVNVANLAPSLSLTPPAGVPEGTAQTWTATASDVAADTVTVGWQVIDAGANTIDTGTGLTFTTTYPDNGDFVVFCTASDEDGGVSTVANTTSITNVAPVPSISGSNTGTEGSPVTFTGSATDVGTADGIALTWDLQDSGGSSVTTGSGASFSVTLDNEGTFTVLLTATDDDNGSATTTSPLTIANVAPNFTSTPVTALDEDVAWQYLPTVAEPGNDTLTFSLTGAPAAMTLDAGTGQLDWTPLYADGSSATFDLTVTDGVGSATQTIALTIAFLDSEPDGMADGWETANSLDPSVDDSAGDPDADGVSNLDEFLGGTDPNSYDGPDVPVALAPIDEDEVAVATPQLSWTNATDANGEALTYDVELYADAGMTNLQDSTSGLAEDSSGTTTWTPSVAIAENATGWWRVRAADPHVAGVWTDLEGYFVNETNEAPQAPEPLAPLEGDSVASITPQLSWTEGTDVDQDALTYDIEVVDGTNTLVTSTTGLTDLTWTVDTDLTEDAWYSWEVRSVDPDGLTSDWIAGQAFFVDVTNSPPADVTWVTPTDGDDLVDLAPLLEVNDTTDPEDEAITYEVEIDGGTTSESLASATPLWDLADEGITLDEHVTYTLRARAVDNRGAASGWSEIQVFTRGPNDGTDAPALLAPDDGATFLVGDPITFVLGHVTDPEGDDVLYGIAVATDAPIEDVVEFGGVEAGEGPEGTADQTSWQPTEALPAGQYFWQGGAGDGEAEVAHSGVRSFTVEEPPPAGDDDDSAGGETPDCGCESSLADGAPTALWLVLLLLVPALRRRR